MLEHQSDIRDCFDILPEKMSVLVQMAEWPERNFNIILLSISRRFSLLPITTNLHKTAVMYHR
jgi:hypothetical protein